MNDDLVLLARRAAEEALLLLETMEWGGTKSIRSQIQRSAFSVPSNISEGIGRGIGRGPEAQRSKLHFYRIALGSLKECVTQLEMLKNVKPELKSEISVVVSLFLDVEDRIAPLVGSKEVRGNVSDLEREMWCWFDCSCGRKSGIYVYLDGTVMFSPCHGCGLQPAVDTVAPRIMTPDVIYQMSKARNVIEQISILLDKSKKPSPEMF